MPHQLRQRRPFQANRKLPPQIRQIGMMAKMAGKHSKASQTAFAGFCLK
jgi:hypothetical protein